MNALLKTACIAFMIKGTSFKGVNRMLTQLLKNVRGEIKKRRHIYFTLTLALPSCSTLLF